MSTKDFDMEQLSQFMKSIADADTVRVKVGILGDGANSRREGEATPGKKFKGKALSTVTNAEIGLFHEFGDPTRNLPVRSFLRMPIITRLQKYLEDADAFSPRALKKVMEQRSVAPWLTKVGVVAETVIFDAFDTGGFGTWPASNMKNKKVHQTLVETQQLRNSITSEVTGGD